MEQEVIQDQQKDSLTRLAEAFDSWRGDSKIAKTVSRTVAEGTR